MRIYFKNCSIGCRAEEAAKKKEEAAKKAEEEKDDVIIVPEKKKSEEVICLDDSDEDAPLAKIRTPEKDKTQDTTKKGMWIILLDFIDSVYIVLLLSKFPGNIH